MYAISYDDPETLAEFAEKQGVHFPLLSDIDSKVIRQFGILNEQVTRNDALLYGIPYPGVYVTNEAGTVVAKFFHDSYKKRESPEFYIDAALGRLSLDERHPKCRVAIKISTSPSPYMGATAPSGRGSCGI